MKTNYNNFGTIIEQHFVSEFEWNDKQFNSYLIRFDEYDGLFRIIREQQHEQALIGGKMLFNYSQTEEKITGYRIIGFDNKVKRKPKGEDKVKELLRKRKEREMKKK